MYMSYVVLQSENFCQSLPSIATGKEMDMVSFQNGSRNIKIIGRDREAIYIYIL